MSSETCVGIEKIEDCLSSEFIKYAAIGSFATLLGAHFEVPRLLQLRGTMTAVTLGKYPPACTIFLVDFVSLCPCVLVSLGCVRDDEGFMNYRC